MKAADVPKGESLFTALAVGSSLPPAENAESVNAFFERILNAGDVASLESLAHRDVVAPESGPGIEGLRRLLVEMRNTFASPEYKVMDMVSEDEKVVVRYSAKATHAGRFMGIPATGRKLKFWGVMLFRFEAGAIAEFWSVVEAQAILKQLREP
jgi:steroid delta-isomerase-like uncharacterized protein